MANDRLIIRCTGCDAHRVVGKWYPGMAAGGDPLAMAAFMVRHTDCAIPVDRGEYKPEVAFELFGEQKLADTKGGIDWNADYWEREREKPKPTRPID